jgi:hypothetical protein
MGLKLGPVQPEKIFDEIRATVRGYNVLPVIATGAAPLFRSTDACPSIRIPS